MKFRLIEDQINYNANPQDKNIDDCSIRALSLAYNMNYNSVRNKLNSIGHKNNTKFNELNNIKEFIEDEGYTKHIDDDISTVGAFTKKYRHGIFIVYCSNGIKQDTSNAFHLTTVIDGKIYDTWDCDKYYFIEAWQINNNINNVLKNVNN